MTATSLHRCRRRLWREFRNDSQCYALTLNKLEAIHLRTSEVSNSWPFDSSKGGTFASTRNLGPGSVVSGNVLDYGQGTLAVAALKNEGVAPLQAELPQEGTPEGRPSPHTSSVRPRAVANLRFEDGPDDSLTAVEFEAPPQPAILYAICNALSEKQISIVDSATRITPRALFQRFQLRETDGAHVVGERRREVEILFVEALSGL